MGSEVKLEFYLKRFDSSLDHKLTLMASLFSRIKTIFYPPLLIIAAGTSEYGFYVILSLVLLQMISFSQFGLGFGYRRSFPSVEFITKAKRLFYPQFFFKLLIIFIVLTIFNIFSSELISTTLDKSLRLLLSFLLVISFLSNQLLDYLRYSSRSGWMSIFLIVNNTFTYIFIGLLFYFEFEISIFRIFFIEFISLCLIFFTLLFFFLLEMKLKQVFSNLFYSLSTLKEDMRLGLPEFIKGQLEIFSQNADKYIIALFVGSTSLATYVPVLSIASFIQLVPLSVALVTFTELARAIDLEENYSKIITNSIIKILYFVVPWIFFCLSFGGLVLDIWLNGAIKLEGNDGLILIFASIGTLFLALNSLNLTVLTVLKLTYDTMKYTFISAIFSVLFLLVTIPIFKELFLAALCFMLSQMLIFFISKKKFELYTGRSFPRLDFIKIVACSMLCILIINSMFSFLDTNGYFNSLISLILSCSLGAFVYIYILNLFNIRFDQ